MENSTNANKSRVLVSRILVEPGMSEFLTMLYSKLPNVFLHSVDVAYLSGEVALELDLAYADDIIRGALLHDIGKLRVPHDLLETSRKLTPEEKAVLQTHSELGFESVRNHWYFSDIVFDIIRHHHEKQDGSGYPSGLKALDIKKAVKIVTVCDIYDAMTRVRPYGKKYNAYEALNIMTTEPIDRSVLKILKECSDR